MSLCILRFPLSPQVDRPMSGCDLRTVDISGGRCWPGDVCRHLLVDKGRARVLNDVYQSGDDALRPKNLVVSALVTDGNMRFAPDGVVRA